VLGSACREFFEQHPEDVGELWAQAMELRRTAGLVDLPAQMYPFADVHGALRAIAGRRAMGKVVLSRPLRP
jgi:hypothetical protein